MNMQKTDRQLTAVVTGAGQGIGKSISQTLAAKGMRIFLVDKTEEKLKKLQEELTPDKHEIIVADLDKEEGQNKLLEFLNKNQFPDVIVISHETRVQLASIDKYCSNSLANENTSIRWLKKVLPQILESQRKNKYGRWIAISSMVNQTGGPGQANYMLKKSILESMMRSIAVEDGKYNITANIVSPGIILTEGLKENYSPEIIDRLSQMNVMGRAGTPAEVAEAVSFLADASYVTGINLPVCGGYNLGWSLLKI